MFPGQKGAQVQTPWPRLAPTGSGGHICGPWGPTALPASQGLQVGLLGLSPQEGGPGVWAWGSRGAVCGHTGAPGERPPGAHEGVFLGGSEPSALCWTLLPLFMQASVAAGTGTTRPAVQAGASSPRAPRGGDTCGKWATGLDGCEQNGVASVGLQM